MDSPLPALAVNPALLAKGGVENPRDGDEFLANVVLERLACREVVVAPPPPTQQNVFVSEEVRSVPSCAMLLPTREWQHHQVADFSSLRARLARMTRITRPRTPLAPKETPRTDSVAQWRTFLEANEPTLELVCAFTQDRLHFLLEVLLECLKVTPQGDTLDASYGRWLFAVLASLQLPLRPDVHSSLRDVARICSKIRSKLSFEDDTVCKRTAPLNLFICLIARYFRQGDLAD